MNSFAHMADVHLGAHREPALQKLEREAFELALSRCVDEGVDFLLVSGDLFHVGIPDLAVVNSALRKMMELRDAGIPIYAIYGSHDYTPTGTSVIDILDTAGVLTNVSKMRLEGGKVRLGFVEDEKTGAKLAGISARKVGLESRYYELLDRAPLEAEEGFKVFAFHSGITQFKPPQLSEMETVDLSLLPRGFDYYAGGHIHRRGEFSLEGYSRVVFPGPLFTGYGRDVEDTAKGERRGLYLVRFDGEVREASFVPVEVAGGAFDELDVSGMNSSDANRKVAAAFGGRDVAGRLVAFKVYGELAGGRASDLELAKLKARLMDAGAVHVYLNRAGVSTRETAGGAVAHEDPATIERALFEREAPKVKVAEPRLAGARGVETAAELLKALRQGQKTSEGKKDYEARMIRDGSATLGMEEGRT